MIRFVYFAAVLLIANPLLAQNKAQDDTIAETLTAAKAAYKEAVEQASNSLLAEIDARIENVENNSKLSVESQLESLKALAAAREAFVKDQSNVPSQRKLVSAKNKFERLVRNSRKDLEDAFDKAADAYRKPPIKDFKAAERVLKERKEFFADKLEKQAEGSNVAFNPAFNDKNWKASSPKLVTFKDDCLKIAAAPNGNVLLTKKTDYKRGTDLVDVIIEVAAAEGTEAFIILNAQQKAGKWSGVTSRIHFENGKIQAGGQRSGFRQNSGRQQEFEAGEYFTLRLYVHEHGKDPNKALVKSSLNGNTTGHTAYEWYKTNKSGALGFVVLKGALSIKKFEVLDAKKQN